MRTVWTALLAASGLVGGATMARAQSPLTLEAAQAEARQHAPERATLDAGVAGAQAIADQAGRAVRTDPEVQATFAPGRLAAQPDESSWTVGIHWTVDISRSWVPRAQSAAADRARAEADREAGLRALDESVAVAFADVDLAQETLARSQRLRALQALAAEAEHHRLQVGDGTQLEADAADLDLASARVAEEQAAADLAAARAHLARLLGRTTPADLVVADPPEPTTPILATASLETVVVRDPRIAGAQAELNAARFEQDVARRLLVPAPTFGLDVSHQRTDIPVGALFGSAIVNGVGANWRDREVALNVTLPVPLFDRQREPRARATARVLAAEAQVQVTTADVREELQHAEQALQAAARAWEVVAGTPALVERDAGFLEQAVTAGELSSVARAQALRRLDDAGRQADEAQRALRVARAAWIRRTAGP